MAVGITSYTCATVSSVSTVPKNKARFRSVTDYEGKFIKRLYHADNLDVLNFLVKDDDVCGKVNLIYIDPPYNTGGAFETKDFKHAYNDNFTTEGYLDFMKPRLTLMHRLLSPSGSIYVHLDCNMLFHVKILMDSIFGERNFRGMITRKKCKSKNFTRTTYGNISDYILFYTKSESPVWNRPYEDWDEKKALQRIQESDENRAGYHRSFYNVDINDASLYHAVLNTGKISLDNCAKIISDIVETKVTVKQEEDGNLMIEQLLKAQSIVNKLYFEERVNIDFMHATIEGNTIYLHGVSDSPVVVESALQVIRSQMPEYEAKSAVSIIHDFKTY